MPRAKRRNRNNRVRVRTDVSKWLFNEKAIMYYRLRPVQAAEDLLNMKLAWFQRFTLRSMWFKPYVMQIFGRGCGKTRMNATVAVLKALLYPNYKVGVFGPIKKQGDYIFNEIEFLYNNSPFFQASIIKGISRSPERSIVKFVNGSYVESLPPGDGTKMRGAHYNMICLDEYAQFDESIINLVIIPFMVVKQSDKMNSFIISSSAYYQHNHMYDRFIYYKKQQIKFPNLYDVFEYDFRDILLDKNGPRGMRVDMNVIKQQQELMTEDEFRMEYLGVFPSDADTFFSVKLFDECTPKPPKNKPIEAALSCYHFPVNPKTGKEMINRPKINDGFDYVMGVDIAKAPGGANFAIIVCRIRAGKAEVIYCHTINGGTYKQMVEAIRLCTINFNITRIHMDRGGGGEAVKEELAEKWYDPVSKETYMPILDMDDDETEDKVGLRYLRLVNFQGSKHANLFTNLKSEMEHGRVLFPIMFRKDENKDMERLGKELVELRKEMVTVQHDTRGANFHFQPPTKKARMDRLVALTLAIDTRVDNREHDWQDIKQVEELDSGFAVV